MQKVAPDLCDFFLPCKELFSAFTDEFSLHYYFMLKNKFYTFNFKILIISFLMFATEKP